MRGAQTLEGLRRGKRPQAGGSSPLASWCSKRDPGLQGPSARRRNSCSEHSSQSNGGGAATSPLVHCQFKPQDRASPPCPTPGIPACFSRRMEHMPERVRASLLQQQLQCDSDGAARAEQEGGCQPACASSAEAALIAELRLFNNGTSSHPR